MTETTEKLAYSIKEACEATSLSRTTIYSHIAARRLHVVPIGGRTIIPAESLRSFLTGVESE
jgi:excisionase family DNA binding protein